MKKKVITNQQYEDYWKITLEYTDYTQKPFNDVLNLIVNCIDKYVDITVGMSPQVYQQLQKDVEKLYPKNDSASTRKSINQFFKLGFINNYGKGYHYLTKKFLMTADSEQKKIIYSKIMYENASFSRSYKNASDINEIKFLVKTLEECGTISKQDLLALIYTDILNVPKGYLTKKELGDKYSDLVANGADNRKYNQCSYLFGVCKTLTDIYVSKDGTISLQPSQETVQVQKAKVRDPYLQHLYKLELIKEYKTLYNVVEAACVLEHLAYPVLIASHIKPYKDSDEKEKFDPDNGLLLSKNMDSLFDLGYITFDDYGNVITSAKLNSDVASYVRKFKIDSKIFNTERQNYMKYHREHVFIS